MCPQDNIIALLTLLMQQHYVSGHKYHPFYPYDTNIYNNDPFIHRENKIEIDIFISQWIQVVLRESSIILNNNKKKL